MFITALFIIAKENKLEITHKSINGKTVIYLPKGIILICLWGIIMQQWILWLCILTWINLKNTVLGRKGKKQKNVHRMIQFMTSSKAKNMKLHIV